MKVALFSRFPLDVAHPRGGVETVTLALVRSLVATGQVDLHVVTLEKPGRATGRQAQEGATIHRLPGSSWPLMLDLLGGPARARLKKYLEALQPDLVHCHETHGLGLTDLKLPLVMTIHGFDHANLVADHARAAWLRSPLWKLVENRCLKRHRHIISITPYVRDYIAARTPATIYEIDNPIARSCFDIERHEVPGRIFYAGWISPRKNALGLTEAFARLSREGVAGTLHLAGEIRDAAYGAEIRALVDRAGLGDRVRLLGRISHDQVRQELAEAAVFALPSRQENSPMAIEEAMAAGVPVVTSNRCGMPFMVRQGVTGFLTDPEDIDGLKDGLKKFLSDDSFRHAAGAAARADAVARFHPEAVAKKTLEVYRQVIEAFDGQ